MAPSTSSLAAARRQQDGPRRVSFSETRLTSSRLYDSDEDDEEAERLREEEEERALSERFGEAAETDEGSSNNNKRKRAESEKDIAKELDQEEKKKTKKQRPQLVEANLTDANGLIKLPIAMKRIKHKPKKKRDVVAAGAYCNKLVNAYRSFCDDIMPSLNFEDVLLKIEQLGGKTDVKQFVQHMRDNVRNEHLERMYGREKAERMIQELNDGMKQSEGDFNLQESQSFADSSSPQDAENFSHLEADNISKNATAIASNEPDTSDASGLASGGEEEQEATFEELPTCDTNDDAEDVPAPSKVESATETPEPDNDNDSDDEEEEATFDDVMQVEKSTPPDESSTKEAAGRSSNKEVDANDAVPDDTAQSPEPPSTKLTTAEADNLDDSTAVGRSEKEKAQDDNASETPQETARELPKKAPLDLPYETLKANSPNSIREIEGGEGSKPTEGDEMPLSD